MEYLFYLSEEVKEKLKKIASAEHATLFSALLTAFTLYIGRICNSDDITLGIAAAGRENSSLHNMIGFFINTVVIRSRIDKEASFTTLLRKSNAELLESLEYQNIPLELICEKEEISYPRLDLFFNMLSMFGQDEEITELQPDHSTTVHEAKFPLTCYMVDHKNCVKFIAHYRKELFKEATVEYLMNGYLNFIAFVADNSDKPLKEYGSSAKKRVLKRGCD